MSDAVAELKARQGTGARYDAPNAPAEDLLLARRGTAYFARKLNELTDRDLDHGNRRQIIAKVSYDARALAGLMAALRGGWHAADPRREALPREIAFGAALPAHALRHLFHHTEVHLNVEWRDLSAADWDRPLPGGGIARELPLQRAKALWLAAIDLGNGGRERDMPVRLRGETSGSNAIGVST
ncbi:DinB family protein [Tropicibacter oceani]|uniref:Maleylpyruvate isomerase n=1 Tax=Tropicibacter oceani TaxID=3058420 RepID=A0ABY8QJE2_9RHOB|nr:hypothetical protein [Tropicibacter oceani]WGW04760.1 hypothetical protein QF118_04200 [Tropicibacter oceani]